MKLIRPLTFAAMGMVMLSSCNSLYDDLGPCPAEPKERDVELSFRYDYNMDYTDYFDLQVHCLDLYIFDEAGNRVGSYQDQDKSTDGNYTVAVNLLPGKYTAVVYGGTACDDASFEKKFTDDANLKLQDLKVEMKSNFYYLASENTDAPGSLYEYLSEADHESLRLHRLFYGKADFVVTEETTRATLAINPVELQRNTNIIKVKISNKNGNTVKKSDYKVYIEDDNNSYNYLNNLEHTGKILYRPYVKDDNENDNEMTAEFTISRLMSGNSPKLIIRDANNSRVTADIDIISTVLLNNSTNLPAQEYLDRENTWQINVALGDDPTGTDTTVTLEPWDYSQVESGI